MSAAAWSRISLARKCQLLFGAAVLSSIAAALFLPIVRMNDLTRERYLSVARNAAVITSRIVDINAADIQTARERLASAWPDLIKQQPEFPVQPPVLYSTDELAARQALAKHGFIATTVAEFKSKPQEVFKFKIDEDTEGHDEVRLAMAVRAAPTDPDPARLTGLIEVHIPIDRTVVIENWAAMAAAVLCGALLAVLVFYLVTQRLLLSPVRKLRRLAEQVTTGDTEARSTIATGDEFEDLGDAFNDMLAHLHQSREELRKINVSLDTRLGELAETNVALFESNKLKSEFIANVSHELRTPLVSIIGFAELLTESGDGPAKPERLKRYARNILTSGRMLMDIINDLLDLARIEAGKLELHVVTFDPSELCASLIDFVTPLADKKQIRLELRQGDNLPRMTSDAGRIKQILYNLLSNAIKFTPENGSVTLAVRRAGDADDNVLVFSVTDTGPGIEPEMQSMIFEKFRQIDASVTREFEGTGLGLAITRELCTMLGGDVQVESQLGQGSTFTVRLPVEAPSPQARRPINLAN